MSKQEANFFLQSLNNELVSQASRVRNLIGDAHWLSDGQHKESLISGVVSRFIPDSYKVSSGFGINTSTISELSKELDVTILDQKYDSPILDQFGFSVAAFESIAGVISVKSALTKKSLLDSIENLASVAGPTKHLEVSRRCCLTTFFFDDDIDCESKGKLIKKWCDQEPEFLQQLALVANFPFCLASTSDLFMRFRPVETSSQEPEMQVCVYRCPGLAFAHFVTFLQNSLALRRGNTQPTLQQFVNNYEASELVMNWTLNLPS